MVIIFGPNGYEWVEMMGGKSEDSGTIWGETTDGWGGRSPPICAADMASAKANTKPMKKKGVFIRHAVVPVLLCDTCWS
jgi:hypothetical protein